MVLSFIFMLLSLKMDEKLCSLSDDVSFCPTDCRKCPTICLKPPDDLSKPLWEWIFCLTFATRKFNRSFFF